MHYHYPISSTTTSTTSTTQPADLPSVARKPTTHITSHTRWESDIFSFDVKLYNNLVNSKEVDIEKSDVLPPVALRGRVSSYLEQRGRW